MFRKIINLKVSVFMETRVCVQFSQVISLLESSDVYGDYYWYTDDGLILG
jgi:hypothetical protein